MSQYSVRDLLRYTGPSKSLRLLYVSKSPTAPLSVKVDALCLLRESLVNDTMNTALYRTTFVKGKEIKDDVVDEADQRCPIDEEWLRKVSEKSGGET